jgi:hypothetical protein
VSTSDSITFRNAFNEPIELLLELTASDSAPGKRSAFALLKKTKSSLPALANIQIPFSFAPTEISETRAVLRATCAERDLTWTYNIRGISECPPPELVLEFVCKSRNTRAFPVSLLLPGLRLAPGQEEAFTHELVVRTRAFLRCVVL